ncbi:MAG: class I SAM-dependent methyltransferase [Candidatus Coatesbacteria bacterium]|nr:MAG: class I SAM-dependent methyltransferase [Candidatus Coatesbacteria bacterium]
MNLRDVIERRVPPEPWAEGDNIPWDEPAFSARMLAEHLSQEHDAASRRLETIDEQVEWIHDELLSGKATRVLDLCCGPGLYASRLAGRGYEVVGIDYSPASIEYAEAEARREGLAVTYLHRDVRAGDYGDGFGLAMLIYGEFNTLRPADGRAVLDNVYRALSPGGTFVLEVHPREMIKLIGTGPATWRAEEAGLFSDRPHLRLDEHFWDEGSGTATTRYYIIEAASGDVTRHAQTFQAYTEEEYRALLREAGFGDIAARPDFPGRPVEAMGEFVVYTARKAGPA